MKTTTRRSVLGLIASLPCVPLVRLRAQPVGKRQQFIYVLRVTSRFHEARNWTDKENAATARHFERLGKATQEGQVILAGRTREALGTTFGIVIFEAENEDEARQFMEADPAVASGVMSATLHPYTVALQRKQ